MEVNIYDFDKTIFDGDCTHKFYLYLLKKYPILLIYLPKQFIFFILFLLRIINKTKFKENFFTCLKLIDNIDEEITSFWNKNINGIKKWYLNNKNDNDIIISASPEFLLKPICNKLGIKNLIASNMDKKNGKFSGLNCYGEEKVKRLNKFITNIKIKEFYSDSFSDEPLAKLAEQSYMVLGNEIYLWWEYKKGNLIKK